MPRSSPTSWEVDAIPLQVQLRDRPGARTVALLVGAGGLVLGVDLASDPPSEPEDVAARFGAEVEKAVAATGGAWPRTLTVRHAAVAAPLARALAPHGVRVQARPGLPTIDAAAPALQQHMGMGGAALGADPDEPGAGPAGPLLFSAPESWHAWGLPPDAVAALFAAAARFHAARPWTHLYNPELLTLDVPRESGGPAGATRWTACVLGNGGEQFGLVLYADAEDFFVTASGAGALGNSGALRDAVLTLDFTPRRELPRAMQREIAAAGWPVAGPDAYPRLWALNTPAGGVTRAQARALTLALDAVARFTAAHDALLAGHPRPEPALAWEDAETGVRVSYAGDVLGEDDDALWDPPAVLTPGGAEGPEADPLAGLATGPAVADPDDQGHMPENAAAVADRFRGWLAVAPPAAGRVRRPAGRTVQQHAEFAELFVEFVAGYQGVALGAVHEFDLRAFLYDWFPRKVRTSRTHAMAAPAGLRAFFRYLAEARGLACPWAEPVLADRDAYAERWESFPGGFWWDEAVVAWQQELARDFHERVFLPDQGMAGGDRWGGTMGPDEARLHAELGRRWLGWREEEIRAGRVEPAAVRAALVARQRAWEGAPHAAFGGRTPAAVVQAERAGRERARPPRAKRPGRRR